MRSAFLKNKTLMKKILITLVLAAMVLFFILDEPLYRSVKISFRHGDHQLAIVLVPPKSVQEK
jgi:hypothetical protein